MGEGIPKDKPEPEPGTNCSLCTGETPKRMLAVVSGVQTCNGICRYTTSYGGNDEKLVSVPNLNGVYVLQQVEGDPCAWRNTNISPYTILRDIYQRNLGPCGCDHFLFRAIYYNNPDPEVIFYRNPGGLCQGVVGDIVYFNGWAVESDCQATVALNNTNIICEDCMAGHWITNVAIFGTMTVSPY